jgi:phage terminase large subunit
MIAHYATPTKVQILKERAPMLTGPLFVKLEQALRRIMVIQGGGDAGKTITILQYLAVKCIQNKGIQCTVVGIDIPNLKRGAMRAFRKYVANNPQIEPHIAYFNKSDREYHFTNGSVISFTSFEDEEDARGSEHDYVFMNEANLQSYNLFWELQRKCRKQIIIDFNPTFSFWAHAKLVNQGEAQFIGQVQLYIVDHRHNPFLTEEEHKAYETISDPERFMVYARGMTGKTKGMIFNFKKVNKIPTRKVIAEDGTVSEEELPFIFGMDIGYTTDKTTIVKTCMDGKNHYYQELLYKSNDEIQDEINASLDISHEKHTGPLLDIKGNQILNIESYIKDILVRNGLTTSSWLWGDHDKVMSAKLRKVGVPYRMAKKGPNSEVASIGSVKRYNGFYIDSPNLENEQRTYVWDTAVDQLTGNEVSIGVPKPDVPDHIIAAIRYSEHSYSMRFAA